jgi:hypothetical protein
MAKFEVTVQRTSSWAALGAMGVIAVAVVTVSGSAESPPNHGSTVATLKVVRTMRSVTVSPTKTMFSHCSGGHAPFRSTPKAMGYPNGRCVVGKPGAKWPITIRNGVRAAIFVQSSNAEPSDGGIAWRPCNLGPHPALRCNGPDELPGPNQFVVENFSNDGQNSTGLGGRRHCDAEFSQLGGCLALSGQLQREGINLIGPSTPIDTSRTWTITITWTAAPP